MDQECLDNPYTNFLEKGLKSTKKCLEVVNSVVSVSMVKICHNPKHLTNYMRQRWIRNVQTTLIPIFFKKRLKSTNNCLEVVNSFVSDSMVNLCQNPKHLTNNMSQRSIRSVQTTLIPIFFPKRLNPTKNCLEVVNRFVSVSLVKMRHNPTHLSNCDSKRWIMSVQPTLIPILSQKRLKPTNNCL